MEIRPLILTLMGFWGNKMLRVSYRVTQCTLHASKNNSYTVVHHAQEKKTLWAYLCKNLTWSKGFKKEESETLDFEPQGTVFGPFFIIFLIDECLGLFFLSQARE